MGPGRRRFRVVSISVILISFLARSGETPAFADADEVGDPVTVFKQAISSPPSVELFLATQRLLTKPALPEGYKDEGLPSHNDEPEYFQGARSGSNFFFRALKSLASTNDLSQSTSVFGSKDGFPFEVNLNTLTVRDAAVAEADPDYLQEICAVNLKLLNQCLNMGLSDVTPSTVIWDGNTFSALRNGRTPVFGQLSVSNGLPDSLHLSTAKGGPAYLAFYYQYHGTASTHSGYPSKIQIARPLGDGHVVSLMDISLLAVKTASTIPSEFFAPSRFLSTNILFTNVYKNGRLMGPRRKPSSGMR